MSESKPTQAQLNANRENAKKSTGPTSETGKEKSKYNATRHNLTGKVRIQTSEDMDAYYKFTQAITIELDPEGPIENNLAQSIADAQWRLSRAPAYEENILTHDLFKKGDRYNMNHPEAHAGLVQSVAFFERSKELANISLYEQRLNNQLHKNLKALIEMKKHRALRKSPDEVKVMAAASAGYEPDETPEATGIVSLQTTHPETSTATVKPVPDRLTTNPESTTSPENGFVLSNTPTALESEPETRAPDLKNAA